MWLNLSDTRAAPGHDSVPGFEGDQSRSGGNTDGDSAAGWAAAEGMSGRGQIWVAGGAGWAAAWAMPPCGARGGLHRLATQGWAGVMASKTQARQAGRDGDISTSRSRTHSSPFAPLISKGANVSSWGDPWGERRSPPGTSPSPTSKAVMVFPLISSCRPNTGSLHRVEAFPCSCLITQRCFSPPGPAPGRILFLERGRQARGD